MPRLLLAYTIVLWILQLAGGFVIRQTHTWAIGAAAVAAGYGILVFWAACGFGHALRERPAGVKALLLPLLLVLWQLPGLLVDGWATQPLGALALLPWPEAFGGLPGSLWARLAQYGTGPLLFLAGSLRAVRPGKQATQGAFSGPAASGRGQTAEPESDPSGSARPWQPARRAADVIERANAAGGRRRRAR